jgi:hypothetical protein
VRVTDETERVEKPAAIRVGVPELGIGLELVFSEDNGWLSFANWIRTQAALVRSAETDAAVWLARRIDQWAAFADDTRATTPADFDTIEHQLEVVDAEHIKLQAYQQGFADGLERALRSPEVD